MITAIALHGATVLVNRLLKSDPVSQMRIQDELSGKVFRFILHKPNMALDVHFLSDGKISTEPTPPKSDEATAGPFDQPSTAAKHTQRWALSNADCTLEVDTLTDAFSLLSTDTAYAPVTGDMKVLQSLKNVLGGLDISLGERLSPFVGASIAGQVDKLLKNLKRGTEHSAKASMYAAEELVSQHQTPLATGADFAKFKDMLRTLRTEVERVDAALRAREAQLGTKSESTPPPQDS